MRSPSPSDWASGVARRTPGASPGRSRGAGRRPTSRARPPPSATPSASRPSSGCGPSSRAAAWTPPSSRSAAARRTRPEPSAPPPSRRSASWRWPTGSAKWRRSGSRLADARRSGRGARRTPTRVVATPIPAALGRSLPRRFYERSAPAVARGLLGCILVSRVGGVLTAGRIVETEAYLGPEDGASHAAFRPSSRWLFYGPGGVAYVFPAYGLHACLNAIAGPPGTPGCVLIRALEPLTGVRTMARRRRHPVPRRPTAGSARRSDQRARTAHPGARDHRPRQWPGPATSAAPHLRADPAGSS